MTCARRPHRRQFVRQASALTAAGLLTAPTAVAAKRAANERLNLAIVGVEGQGAYNLAHVAGENIVALCDVDAKRAAKARERFPRATFYQDFRKMLDQKGIDAIVVSTPDHLHALVAVPAMRAGKHVYCEKPLAHSVHEVRLMMATAAEHKVVTQMGTQIHAENNYRRVVERIQDGVIGTVRRVHVWCARQPDPGQLGKSGTRPPEGLAYDLWLGPAPERPYDPSHIPFKWRWWWDFGGGVLADMACHFMDLPFWALGLGAPTTIAAKGEKLYKGDNNVPSVMQVDYTFPARGERPAVELTWYHGVAGPDLAGKRKFAGYPNGVLFEGDKGQLVSDYHKHQLLPEKQFAGFVPPEQRIPASAGHHREWLEAIRTGGPTTCPFAYSGVLSEAVLLGNVAYRCGRKLTWDAKAGTADVAAAAKFLRREYRKGWTL